MPSDPPDIAVIVSAYQEEERIASTLAALARALPGARLLVADDGSRDATPDAVRAAGAELVRSERTVGKGGAMTLAARRVLERPPAIVVLCDGDLAQTAGELGPLVAAVRDGECDLAIARFARRVGGGVGAALGFSRWATRRRCGLELAAPISGQRAMRAEVLRALLPFA